MPLAEKQRAFGTALLDASLPMPPGLVGPDGRPSIRRFSVYRNNVVVGLVEALKSAYPVVCRIVGEEFFKAMARAFVVKNPPVSPILLEYGEGFADFVASFEPAASLPYLSDVARIERAWVEAYHAPEATPIDASDLMRVAPDQLHSICFIIHPSVRITRSLLPAHAIWKMNAADAVPAPIELNAGGEDTLIVRPDATVTARLFPVGGADFLGQLASGATVIDAAKTCMSTNQSFDLAGNLSALIDAGAFTGWRLENEPSQTITGEKQ